MLYTKSIQEITWDDVVEFCNQEIPENPTLDYKKDFPNNLQKSIASFANTLGGLILIGVDEDTQSKPNLPINGIDNERGLAERVTNIILTNLTPPVFPEIKICENSDKSRVIVIIRIPQSNQSPHAINKNTQVYIRTNNKSTPEELASLERIFWLKDKRNNSLQFRNNLINYANSRFRRILKNNREISNIDKNIWLTILMSPIFPEKYYLSPPDIDNNVFRISVKDVFLTDEKFPISEKKSCGTLFQDGTVLDYYHNERAYYSELNCFGLFFYKQNLYSRVKNTEEEDKPTIRFKEVVARLYNYFEVANKFYNFIGYKGYIHFEYKIENLDKHPLSVDNELKESIDDFVFVSKEYKIQEIENPSIGLYVEALKKLSWAYDFNITESFVDSILKEF